MRIRGWGAFITFALATIAAAHQAATANLGMWLAYALLIMAVLFAAGPLSELIAPQAFRHQWGTRKMMIAVGIVAVLGAMIIGTLVKLGIESYKQEQDAIEARRHKEDEREKEGKRLVAALIRSNDELATARTRQDEAERRRERQLAKFQIVNGKIAGASETGGSLRYRVEDAINAAIRAGNFAAFDSDFDNTHTPEIEKWRGDTARMLDIELPGLRLGGSFSEILGEYRAGHSGFRLSQIKECLNFLRRTQQDLRSHIELLIP